MASALSDCVSTSEYSLQANRWPWSTRCRHSTASSISIWALACFHRLVTQAEPGYWEQLGYDRDAWVGRSNGYGT